MTDIYTDEEIRHLAISLLKAPTSRDKQVRIGASNLSNGCDRCLAFNFLGDDRSTPITDRAWMGRVLGTAFHSILEQRVNELVDNDDLNEAGTAEMRRQMAALIGLNPDAKPEVHTYFADIAGYGPVGGTIDLLLSALQLVDWKGSTRKKICILIDYMQIQQGLEPTFGRRRTWVKLSDKEYATEMEKMAYKVTGYYGQQNLYMHGSGRKRASLVFIARDGTGWFDNPAGQRYDDPTAVHDIHVMSFDYDQAYAEWLIDRGQRIFSHLEAGGKPTDFESHALCFACEQDGKGEISPAVAPVPDIDIEVSFDLAA